MKDIDALHKYIDDWSVEAHLHVQSATSTEESCFALGAGALSLLNTVLKVLYPQYTLEEQIEVVTSALWHLNEGDPKSPEILA